MGPLTADQHVAINTAIIQQFLIVIPLMGGVLAAVCTAIIFNVGRIGRQAKIVDALANGKGDDKIDARLRQHGILPPLTVTRATGSQTRAGDAQTPTGADGGI